MLMEGFTVHDVVPGDGNCLFNAIAYQLEFVNVSEMREIITNHLESNSVLFQFFGTTCSMQQCL